MKKFYFLLFFAVFLHSQNLDELYKKAENLEQLGQTQEALKYYKQIAKKALEKPAVLKENLISQELSLKEQNSTQTSQEKELENLQEKKSLAQILGIKAYKTSYLLPVSSTFKTIENRNKFETKFQLSFQKPFLYNVFGLDEIISIAYTQTSWWQTAEDSTPFRETNYQPEIFITFKPFLQNEYFNSYKIGILHESNGKAMPQSRSWNRIYLEANFNFDKLVIKPKIWYRIKERAKRSNDDPDGDDNPNINDYIGNGEVTLIYPYGKNVFKLTARNNFHFDKTNKGSANFEWTFPLGDSGIYGYFQYFTGYGESLIDYDRYINRVGLGFAITK